MKDEKTMEKQIDTPTNTPTKSQYTNCEIEEMAKSVCHLDRTCDECMTSFECKAMMYAKRFYNAGYRKASSVAEEIFAEIDNLLYQDERDYDDLMDSETVAEIYQEYLACSNYIYGVRKAIAELKKKYTEGK